MLIILMINKSSKQINLMQCPVKKSGCRRTPKGKVMEGKQVGFF